jgi:hypothetical protein
MTRQLERKYIELQHAISENGGVECAQLPHVFFPEDEPDTYLRRKLVQVAKEVCNDCPIKDLCFDYAYSAHMQGIWGGTTAEERQAIRENSRSVKAIRVTNYLE